MSIDPLSAIKTGLTAAELTRQGWGWWSRFRKGTVRITHPTSGTPIKPGWLDLSGTYNRAKGHFWLFTTWKGEYWPHGEIDFNRILDAYVGKLKPGLTDEQLNKLKTFVIEKTRIRGFG
jgi:hypothetical protein